MRIQINGNVYTEWHMVYALSRNACLNGEKNVIEYLQRFALISSNDLSIATDLLES